MPARDALPLATLFAAGPWSLTGLCGLLVQTPPLLVGIGQSTQSDALNTDFSSRFKRRELPARPDKIEGGQFLNLAHSRRLLRREDAQAILCQPPPPPNELLFNRGELIAAAFCTRVADFLLSCFIRPIILFNALKFACFPTDTLRWKPPLSLIISLPLFETARQRNHCHCRASPLPSSQDARPPRRCTENPPGAPSPRIHPFTTLDAMLGRQPASFLFRKPSDSDNRI